MYLRDRLDLLKKLDQAGVVSPDNSGMTRPAIFAVSITIEGDSEPTQCWQIVYHGQLAIVCGTTGQYVKYQRKYTAFRYCATSVRWSDDALRASMDGVFDGMAPAVDTTTNSGEQPETV